MSKVPRLYTQGNETITDWSGGNEFPYNQGNREHILDPDGAKATKEITSIPSPFARIDVAKNAFSQVVKFASENNDKLDGETIFYKTVSDVLDIAEIFFNYDKLKDKIEIIKWSPKESYDNLIKSKYEGHKYLGKALKTFWEADTVYNFKKCENIYLLNFKCGKNEMDIIGATSPSTLFFSSANDLSFVSEKICFGQYRPFDKEYCPLHKRTDEEFILYLYYLRDKVFDGTFAELFPEVYKYLEQSFKHLDSSLQDKIRAKNYPDSDYLPIQFSQSMVEILGEKCYMKKVKPVEDSDFEIQPTRGLEHDGILPLVLPIAKGDLYANLKYTEAEWGKDNKVDESCDLPLNERVLPYDGRKQAYLTCDDFLEKHLIRVKHEMNADHYFKMPLISDENRKLSYLLPLKDEFFKYFNPEDLYKHSSARINVKEFSDTGVTVTLEIPIKGKDTVKTVQYTRKYILGDETHCIVDVDFEALVMPNIRMSVEKNAYYTLGLIAKVECGKDLEIEPYKKGEKISENITSGEKVSNNKNTRYFVKTKTLRKSNFEYLRITYAGNTGVVIPKFREQKDNVSFDFAVDLGTSNTHIEYRKYSKGSDTCTADPLPFGYDEGEHIVQPLFINVRDSENPKLESIIKQGLLQSEFLPFGIGDEYEYSFPIPTVLASYKDINNTDARQYPHEYKQVAFTYEKKHTLLTPQTNFRTNIKWRSNSNDEDLRMFIKSLVLLIRNKVLMNDGSLDDIAIRWFYPNSMTRRSINNIKDYWEGAKNELLTDGVVITSMSESKGPLEYLKKTNPAKNVLCIDIGGGTTDVAFNDDKKGEAVTSFRFAGNSLFENQLVENQKENGIIDYYKERFDSIINTNDSKSLYGDEAHKNPANMAGFLFSLKDNKSLSNVDDSKKDFVTMLSNDDDFRIVFILFYSAILYHIGKIIKYKEYKLPRYISLSGNGSKVLGALTTNPTILADFTKAVLADVTGREYGNEKLEIRGLGPGSTPKAHTCKGGLLIGDMRKTTNYANAIIDENIIMHSDKEGVDGDFKVEDIGDEYKKNVIKDVNDFFAFALEKLPKKVSYEDYFGINTETFDIAKEIIKSESDLDNFMQSGIDKLKNEDNDKVSETLFFIPIKGVLNELSKQIYEKLLKKK